MKIKLGVQFLNGQGDVTLDTDKLTDDQRQQLREALQESKEAQGGRLWLPKEGDRHWWVDGVGQAATSEWENNGFNKQNFAKGNVFKTKAEAEKHAQRLKDLYEVNKWIAENCPQWTPNWNDDTQSKWLISYSYSTEELRLVGMTSLRDAFVIPYLETEQQCRDLIAAKTPELKRIFGVELCMSHR